MIIALHKNATITPALRKIIALNVESVATLAERNNLSKDTIRSWRGRDSFGRLLQRQIPRT